MDAITAEATTRADAITAETLARTTADGFKTQLSNNTAVNNSRNLARTTADGLQNTAISNNTDAITAEATTRADAITAEL
jgi:hypothetical protein